MPDYVKIDRRFVAAIQNNRDNGFYIQALVQIAHGCGVRILAQGIESDLEWRELKRMKVDGGQGYYLARPSDQINAE